MYKIALSLSLLLLPFWLSADTADDYFHRGAQYYVWGQKQKSKSEITTGLALYPKDPLLNGMAVLLQKEEQQQQQNQQQNQEQQEQQQQQQEQQAQQDQSQPQNSQQQEQQQSAQQQQQQQQDQQQKQTAAEQQQQDQQEKSSEEKEAAEAKAEGRMTPEEARQLLDAQKGDEKYLNFQQNQKPRDRNRQFKDW